MPAHTSATAARGECPQGPAAALRGALDAHERQEHARRTLHPNSPDIIWTREGAWSADSHQELTTEWWEQHSTPAADPFTLSLIATMRSVLDEYEAEARLMEAGHRTGWTEGGQSVRAQLIAGWAAAYANR